LQTIVYNFRKFVVVTYTVKSLLVMNFGQCASEEGATEMGYGCSDVEPGNYIKLMQLSHYTRRSYY